MTAVSCVDPAPVTTGTPTAFPGVTIITHGFQIPGWTEDGRAEAAALAKGIVAQTTTSVGEYQPGTGWVVPIAPSGQPLLLIANWSKDASIADSGFSEAAADAMFAGLVKLNTDLGGRLFTSPIHFIGLGRGAVVNSEIIQRLGTYFPGIPNLQMTTLNPPIAGQASLDIPPGDVARVAAQVQKTSHTQHLQWLLDQLHKAKNRVALDPIRYSDLRDPDIAVWGNVAFADNYYHHVANANPINGGKSIGTFTHNAASLPEADINLDLTGRAGWTKDTFLGAPGGPEFLLQAWYAGTIDLSLKEYGSFDQTLFRRLEQRVEFLNNGQPWYVSQESAKGTKTPYFLAPGIPNKNASWEGIGEGWFYSVLGGGTNQRPTSAISHTSVAFNNPVPGRTDQAVPGVYNGDFQANLRPVVGRFPLSFEVPGWSLHGGGTGAASDDSKLGSHLVELISFDDAVKVLTAIGHPAEAQTIHLYADGQVTLNEVLRLGSGNAGRLTKPAVPVIADLQNNERINYVLELKGQGIGLQDDGTPASALTRVMHNTFFIPNHAQLLKFSTLTVEPGADEELHIYAHEPGTIEFQLLGKVATGKKDSAFKTTTLEIPANLRNLSMRLQFELVNTKGDPVRSKVWLDDISFLSDLVITDNSRRPDDETLFFSKDGEKLQFTITNPSPTETVTVSSAKLDGNLFFRFATVSGQPAVLAGLNDDNPHELLSNPLTLAPQQSATITLEAGLESTFFKALNGTPGLDIPHNFLYERAINLTAQIGSGAGVRESKHTVHLIRLIDGGDDNQDGTVLTVADTLVGTIRFLTFANPDDIQVSLGSSSAPAFTRGSTTRLSGAKWEIVDFHSTQVGLQTGEVEFKYHGHVIGSAKLEARGTSVQRILVPLNVIIEELKWLVQNVRQWDVPGMLRGDYGILTELFAYDPMKPAELDAKLAKVAEAFASQFNGVYHDYRDNGQLITQFNVGAVDSITGGVTTRTRTVNGHTDLGSFQIISEPGVVIFGADRAGLAATPLDFNIGLFITRLLQQRNRPDAATPRMIVDNLSLIAKRFLLDKVLNQSRSLLTPQDVYLAEIIRYYNLLSGSPASADRSPRTLEGLGVELGLIMAHEFGHSLGLFDTYFLNYAPAAPNNDIANSIMFAVPSGASLLPAQVAMLDLGLDLVGTLPAGEVDALLRFIEEVEYFNNIEYNGGRPRSEPTFAFITTSELDTGSAWSDTEGFSNSEPFSTTATPTETPASIESPFAMTSASSSISSEGVAAFAVGSSEDWTPRGTASVSNGVATLTENSAILSGLSRNFTIAEGTTSFQFTINQAIFGDNGSNPPDAFEAALLDAMTGLPVVGAATGLANTDAFLNLQSTGQIFFGPAVTVTGVSNSGDVAALDSPIVVKVDLSSVTAGTQAVFFFDLLGFGQVNSSVVLDVADLSNGNDLFDNFLDENDVVGAGNLQLGSTTEEIVLLNAATIPGFDSVLAFEGLTGTTIAEYSHPVGAFDDWTDRADRTRIGDVDGDGIAEMIQFNRRAQADALGVGLEGPAIRFVEIATGDTLRTINYEDPVPGGTTTYADELTDLMDERDAVLIGHFSQQTNLEALFFNRTTKAHDTVAIKVLDLVTGQFTFQSLHCETPGPMCGGGIFSGWTDLNDEAHANDTNLDGYDDLVLVNRVANPEAFHDTNKGFIGFVSIHKLIHNPVGPYRGFYHFFAWNARAPGDQFAVFPGYDDTGDYAAAGVVRKHGVLTPVIMLVNSNPEDMEEAVYAILEARGLVRGIPQTFQLISTIFFSDLPAEQLTSFDRDDVFFLADITGDGSDEVCTYSFRSSKNVFRSFSPYTQATQMLSEVPAAAGVNGFAALRGDSTLIEGELNPILPTALESAPEWQTPAPAFSDNAWQETSPQLLIEDDLLAEPQSSNRGIEELFDNLDLDEIWELSTVV